MRVIILGGGFCGSLVAEKLDKHKDIEVVLLDKKGYFEYSPSLWKLLLRKEDLTKYVLPYAKFLRRTRLIVTSAARVTPQFVETETEKLTYNYLVVSTGIDYPIFLTNAQNVFTVKSAVEVVQNSGKIQNAKTILIIGGGLIGTEIAGELATRSPEKHIVLVHPHQRLLERNRLGVSSYAKRFLESRKVSIILGEKVIDHDKGVFITDRKRAIPADVGIWCAGIRSNPGFMTEFPSSIVTRKNTLNVNQFLQLEGYPNIYAGGDVTNIAEEKTALNAERHGRLIGANILRSIYRRRLLEYKPRKLPMIISLGRTHALLTYRIFILPGFVPAAVKWIVEKIGVNR